MIHSRDKHLPARVLVLAGLGEFCSLCSAWDAAVVFPGDGSAWGFNGGGVVGPFFCVPWWLRVRCVRVFGCGWELRFQLSCVFPPSFSSGSTEVALLVFALLK
ncbi:hypothetical protein DY000_02061007 [Brassica cretica]|uniref:Secreted protein n=1 Tax=Brassica cretica TaxID=69181 RepID=A0ABQ7AVF6_BRACR|nr:hypothetical protein DY000_02061007 [Brassica cretica]